MRHLLQKNKKALSEIVGYTILIVIAISLSAMVYSFLQIYVPKEKVECNAEVNLIIGDVSCSLSNGLNLTIINKGLFRADAAYLRFGIETKKIRSQINQNNFLLYNSTNGLGLNPGESSVSIYPIPASENAGEGQYILELQPVVITNKVPVVCEKAIITQPIQCK